MDTLDVGLANSNRTRFVYDAVLVTIYSLGLKLVALCCQSGVVRCASYSSGIHFTEAVIRWADLNSLNGPSL